MLFKIVPRSLEAREHAAATHLRAPLLARAGPIVVNLNLPPRSAAVEPVTRCRTVRSVAALMDARLADDKSGLNDGLHVPVEVTEFESLNLRFRLLLASVRP